MSNDPMSLRDQLLEAKARAAHAEARLIQLRAVADAMADALDRAGDTFTRYAGIHKAKETAEGRRKGHANTAEAARCYGAREAYTEAKAFMDTAPN